MVRIYHHARRREEEPHNTDSHETWGISNQIHNSNLFFREKETDTCFEMLLLLQIFKIAFIYLNDLYKIKKNPQTLY